MASLACCTPSGEPATSSGLRLPAPLKRFVERFSAGFDRLPIRVRLAGVSALLTFVILCAFAIAIGSLTVHRIRSDFDSQVFEEAEQLPDQLHFTFPPFKIEPSLNEFASRADGTAIRILAQDGSVIGRAPTGSPSLGAPVSGTGRNVHGYRVVTLEAVVTESGGGVRGVVFIQYGRRLSETETTVKRVELFLVFGVFGGTLLALLAGMAIARRAMAPIAMLTSAAADIARTRDPSGVVPQSAADDEVAELARTLQGMLRELDAARGETESTLARQRQFVADASHELRTPLTSVLANLELLAESLHGEQGEAARSALRSSRRMRRLVADLLLLARNDAARAQVREPCDLARVVVEAAAELGSVSDSHEISLDVRPATVMGSRDELHRVAINLMENALRHTPPGTAIRVSSATTPTGTVELVVEDSGPGVPAEIAPTLFERFVRGAGDRGGSFGLGLAIVQSVAESHGGSVSLETPADGHGARFVVRLPACSDLDDDRQHHRTALETVVD